MCFIHSGVFKCGNANNLVGLADVGHYLSSEVGQPNSCSARTLKDTPMPVTWQLGKVKVYWDHWEWGGIGSVGYSTSIVMGSDSPKGHICKGEN